MISCKETGEKATRPQVNLQEDRYDYTTQAQLNVTNETLNDISGTVIAELRRSDGKVIDRTVTNVTVPALSSIWLDNTDYNKTDVINNYLSYRFIVNQEIVSEGTCLFTAPKHFNFKNPNLRYEINGDEITVYADAYAKYVEIDSPDCDFVLSDNYFDIDFGSKTVKILEGTPKNIRLRSVYDIR
jgi:beta-mannosidase